MAPSSTPWAATRRTRRAAWVRRTIVGLTVLLGGAAVVVFAATGGVEELRRLASTDVLRPEIASGDGAAQDQTPVSEPTTTVAVERSEPYPLPEVEPPAEVEDVATAPEPDEPEPDEPEPAAPAPDEAPDEATADDDGDDAEEPAEPTLTEIQGQLRALGYLLGPADGVRGAQTRAAVMAFQRVNGLQVDGVIGPRTREALAEPEVPALGAGPATRIEVDLDRQLLHLVEEGERVVTLHVSSGSGRRYTTASGGTAVSNTPVGEFTVERRIAGARRAALGTLYDPLYFHRGWAIHGSDSVPAEPASHGCIRLTRADARWLFQRVPNGIPVHVSGGEHVFTPSGA